MTTKHKKAAGEITRRILTIIDIMAPYRKGMRVDDLHEKLVHKHGKTSFTTVYRDVNVLHEVGYVEKISIVNNQKLTYLYRLDLDRTKHLQQMALSLDSENESCQKR